METLRLLDDVYHRRIDAETAFVETVRVLINMRDEKLGAWLHLWSPYDAEKALFPSLPKPY